MRFSPSLSSFVTDELRLQSDGQGEDEASGALLGPRSQSRWRDLSRGVARAHDLIAGVEFIVALICLGEESGELLNTSESPASVSPSLPEYQLPDGPPKRRPHRLILLIRNAPSSRLLRRRYHSCPSANSSQHLLRCALSLPLLRQLTPRAEIHGDPSPTATKLLFVMGLNNSCYAWEHQAAHFGREKGYQLLVFDNRGVGNSDSPKGLYKTSEMALDTVELLDHVGWEKEVHVIGVSMGGMVAQELVSLALFWDGWEGS